MPKNRYEAEDIIPVIRVFIEDHGYPPTVRELCRITGMTSTDTMHRMLKKLRDEKQIAYQETSPRTITLSGFRVHLVPEEDLLPF